MLRPQAITGDITDQLNAIKDASKLNQMDVQRLKNSIEKVKNVNLAQYHMLYGMFHSIFGDYALSVESHERSLKQLRHTVLLVNYGYSMKRFGCGEKSHQLMLQAFDIDMSEDIFSLVMASAINSGIFEHVEDAVARFEKCNPTKNVRERADVEYLNHIYAELRRAKVSESDYKKAFEIAERVLANHNFMSTIVSVEGSTFDTVRYVSVEIAIPVTTAKEISILQDEIAEQMAESEIEAWGRIVFTVCPLDDHQAA